MTYNKFRRKNTNSAIKPIDALEHPKANVSKKVAQILKNYSDKTGISEAKLLAIAIDNELSAANPFDFEIPDINEIPFDPYAYSNEASRILRYIGDFWHKKGIEYKQLLLCRLDFGIEDKQRVMLACRKLIHDGVAEEISTVLAFTNIRHLGIKLKLETLERIKQSRIDALKEAKGVL